MNKIEEFIYKQSKKDTPIGDLAKDIIADPAIDKNIEEKALFEYLETATWFKSAGDILPEFKKEYYKQLEESVIDYYAELAIMRENEKPFTNILDGVDKRLDFHKLLINNPVKFNEWVVKLNGDIVNSNQHDYTIDNPRLHQRDWISHIKNKGWDMNAFLDAYFFSLQVRNKIAEITIRVSWP